MAKARIEISAVDNLKKGLTSSKQQLSEFEKFTSGLGDKLKQAFTFTAIIAGVKALTSAIGDCVQATKTQIEADTRLQATIKATNSQYIATTAEIKEYAKNLQDVTRFGDDVIESTAALLLATQKFDKEGLQRTIELSADLAEAMGTDLPSAAQTLEKALVDPGEGLSRLRSIGITFTDSEKDLIESLKDAGKEFEAQQIILDKVEAAYGGMAKSIASVDTSTLDKIKNVWSDIKEDLGTLFVDTLGPVFDWIYNTLRWLERLMNQVTESKNFNNYLFEGNAGALADNFTGDYLKKELEKRQKDYWKQVDSIYDEFNNTITSLETAYEINFYDFVKMTRQEQKNILDEYFKGDYSRYAGLFTELGFLSESNTIQRALEIQNNDKLEFALKEAQAAEEAAKAQEEAAARVQAVADRMAKWQKVMEATDLLSGIGDSSFRGGSASTGNGTFRGRMSAVQSATEWLSSLGTRHFQTAAEEMSNAFRDKMTKVMESTDWLSSLGTRHSKGTPAPVEGVATGISFGFQGAAFNLPNNDTGLMPLGLAAAQTGNLGIDSAKGREQAQAANAAMYETLVKTLGEAGKTVDLFTKNIATMGPELGVLVTSLEFVLQGFSEAVGPMLDVITDLVLTPLIEVGKMLGSVIVPILQILAPVLKLIETPILVLSGIIQYVGQALQHWVATLLNWMSGLNIMGWQPFAGLRTYDPGSPGKFGDYMENHLNGFGSTDVAASTSTKTAVSSASYRGATSVTINIYPSGPIVGDGGMRQFAQMIREEFDALDYYGVGA